MTDLERAQLVERIVREVLERLPGITPQSQVRTCTGSCACSSGSNGQSSSSGNAAPEFTGKTLTEARLKQLFGEGCRTLSLAPGTLVTPLASDTAASLGVQLIRDDRRHTAVSSGSCLPPAAHSQSDLSAEGARAGHDGCGTQLAFLTTSGSASEQNLIRDAAKRSGLAPLACSPPEAGRPVLPTIESCLRRVAEGEAARAVIVHDEIYQVLRLARSRKLTGLRSAVCWDTRKAESSRRSGDNVLLLGNRLLGLTAMGRILEAWLEEQ